MIPKETLEIAAKAGIAAWNKAEPDRQAGASYIASHVDSIRAALEAAAPYLRAQALEDAADEFSARLPDGTSNGRAYNSYRVAELLRARAVTERGEG